MNKFLICEDDEDMVDLLNIYLTSKGYNYLIVKEGGAVLPALKNNEIQFLLMDLNLPDIDGKEVIKQIKNDPEINDIPIILFSASSKIKMEAKELNADGYIQKPFELTDLEKVIRENLSHS